MQATFEHIIHLPITWVLATLTVYSLAVELQRRAHYTPWLHPVGVSTATLIAILKLVGIDYETYFSGARIINALLGPATVALAIPIVHQIRIIRRHWVRFCLGSLLGSGISITIAMGLTAALGASRSTVLSISTKSVTMPIALALAEQFGGHAPMAAALIMLTGIFGALTTQAVLIRLRLYAPCAHGFTLGVLAHGIGTARGMQVGAKDGAFAGLGMGLTALLTAVLLPLAFKLAGL